MNQGGAEFVIMVVTRRDAGKGQMSIRGKYEIVLFLWDGEAMALDVASGRLATGAGVGTLAQLGHRRGASVLALTGQVIRQDVALPSAQTAGLGDAELKSALFYEVEPFCLFGRDEALVAATMRAEGKWIVAAARKQEAADLRARVEAAGCRLAGLAAMPADAKGGAKDILERLFPPNGAQEPVIDSFGGAGRARGRIAAAYAVAAGILALCCLGDWMALSARARSLRPRLAESEAEAAANARILSETQSAERRLRELEAAKSRKGEATSALADARDAWRSLLATLAAEAGDDFSLLSIEGGGDAVDSGGNAGAGGADAWRATARCLAPSSEAASGAMARLSRALGDCGWHFAPGGIDGRGGYAVFSFEARRVERNGR